MIHITYSIFSQRGSIHTGPDQAGLSIGQSLGLSLVLSLIALSPLIVEGLYTLWNKYRRRQQGGSTPLK